MTLRHAIWPAQVAAVVWNVSEKAASRAAPMVTASFIAEVTQTSASSGVLVADVI